MSAKKPAAVKWPANLEPKIQQLLESGSEGGSKSFNKDLYRMIKEGKISKADGTRFSLWAPRATRVELALVDEHRRQTNHDLKLVGEGVWEVHVPEVTAGQRYGYRVHGRWSPETGERFNPAKLLLDPYARAITGGVDYSGPITDHTCAGVAVTSTLRVSSAAEAGEEKAFATASAQTDTAVPVTLRIMDLVRTDADGPLLNGVSMRDMAVFLCLRRFVPVTKARKSSHAALVQELNLTRYRI